MSLSRIPLEQVFRSKPQIDTTNLPAANAGRQALPPSPPSSINTTASFSYSPPRPTVFGGGSGSGLLRGGFFERLTIMSQNGGPPVVRGTRTPQMTEYERQAEERAREQEQMQEERERMLEAELKIQREQERIAQEEYEMKQYYEAEALKHAEEVRLHQEEVRRHQERVREHERRIRDHEASSEAFAKVIAMPARPGRDRQISFMSPTATNGNGKVNGA